jgi:antitoxin VapB
VESDADSGVKKASLFMNGRSQAVRLPKEFRFTGDHVLAMRDGDRIILMPHDDRMERLMAAFGAAPDFPDRLPETLQERPALDELFKSICSTPMSVWRFCDAGRLGFLQGSMMSVSSGWLFRRSQRESFTPAL